MINTNSKKAEDRGDKNQRGSLRSPIGILLAIPEKFIWTASW